MDAYSKWPEMHMMESATTELLIKHLQQIFAVHGISHQVVSDNGPQFVAEKFQHYCMSRGIQHITTAPYHPRSNGEAERLVQELHGQGRPSELQDYVINFLPNNSTYCY